MKALITACVSLALCILIAFSAQVYISRTAAALEDILDTLPEASLQEKTPEYILERLDSATEFWSSKHFTCCLIMNRNDFDEITNSLITLRAAVVSGDTGNYASALSSIYEKLRRIREYEKLSTEGIL